MTISLHGPEAYSPIGWKIIQDSQSLADRSKLKRWHVHHVAIALLEQHEGCSVKVLQSLGANVNATANYLREYVNELDRLWEQQAQRIAEMTEEASDYLYGQMVSPTYGLMRLETDAKSVMNKREGVKINSIDLLTALTASISIEHSDYMTACILRAFGISNEAVTNAL